MTQGRCEAFVQTHANPTVLHEAGAAQTLTISPWEYQKSAPSDVFFSAKMMKIFQILPLCHCALWYAEGFFFLPSPAERRFVEGSLPVSLPPERVSLHGESQQSGLV